MEHTFKGKWISNSEFADLKPRNVRNLQSHSGVRIFLVMKE